MQSESFNKKQMTTRAKLLYMGLILLGLYALILIIAYIKIFAFRSVAVNMDNMVIFTGLAGAVFGMFITLIVYGYMNSWHINLPMRKFFAMTAAMLFGYILCICVEDFNPYYMPLMFTAFLLISIVDKRDVLMCNIVLNTIVFITVYFEHDLIDSPYRSLDFVVLLGFGLNMSADDVNLFLAKALREPEINPKNPFEVICWYCYKKHFNYLKFEKLWEDYNEMPVNAIDSVSADGEQTIGVRNSMYDIRDDRMLMAHLSKLKAGKNISVMSAAAKACFDTLYGEARDLIAKMYNSEPDTAQQSGSRSRKKAVTRHDITESDMEQVLCSAIPKDHHGNLTPGKRSKLNEQFAGKRFSRQRISDILAGRAEVTRFDLITLNFFIFSQKLDVYPDPKQRYVQFQDAVDELLEKCFMGKMYVQNPYECFVLMCILSDDPLATYADVWEMSFVE